MTDLKILWVLIKRSFVMRWKISHRSFKILVSWETSWKSLFLKKFIMWLWMRMNLKQWMTYSLTMTAMTAAVTISCQLHHLHILSFQSLFLMWLLIKTRNNSKILRKSVKVLIITSLTVKFSTQFIIELTYLSKKRNSNWMNQSRIQRRAKTLTLIILQK